MLRTRKADRDMPGSLYHPRGQRSKFTLVGKESITMPNLHSATNCVVAAATILTLTSCSKHPAGGPQGSELVAVWLATKAVAALAKTFRAVGLEAAEQRTSVSVVGRTVSVNARVTNTLQQNSRYVLAAEFEISVDGIQIPTLLAGAIGVDDTPEHARDTVAAEWASQFGAPIGFALASQFGDSDPPPSTSELAPFFAKVEVDGQSLFHGPVGLRGEAKVPGAVSSDEFVRRVATFVAASLRRKPPVSEYRSALVQVVVTGTAVTGGECRVDGLISTELLETLSRLSWPEGSPSYMFKLFFVGSAHQA
jgi:hypothetical protein